MTSAGSALDRGSGGGRAIGSDGSPRVRPLSSMFLWAKHALAVVFQLIAGSFTIIAALLLKRRRRALVWGPVPIINNKYWSAALGARGYDSYTLVSGFYASINQRRDFDVVYDDLVPRWIRWRALRELLGPFAAFLHVVRNAAVLHLPFSGGPLGGLPWLWRAEATVYRVRGIRTVVIPYGADAYMYSRVIDPSLRNALLTSYPAWARLEPSVTRRVDYWSHHADAMICGFMSADGLPRWDVPSPQPICIDIDQWKPKGSYSRHDGRDGPVRVLHSPNHRGFKGTEFLLDAVRELRAEGLNIELLLMERVPNEEVRSLMQSADILLEQCIATAYALSGVEGMASGLPVLANLENPTYTQVFRRYAFLSECPILSTTPETLVDRLRVLIRNPSLREELGRAGRAYVEKYHSFETAQYLFGSIYDKLLHGREVDLTNLFHPLKSEFNRRRPRVQHPLVDNQIPAVANRPFCDASTKLAE